MPYITSIERLAKQEGLREGLICGIELALQLKFGKDAESLFSEIEAIEDLETLKEIQAKMLSIESQEGLQNIYRKRNSRD